MPVFNPFTSPMTLSQHYLTWKEEEQWGRPREKCSSRSKLIPILLCAKGQHRENVCGRFPVEKSRENVFASFFPVWEDCVVKYCVVRTCLHLVPGVLQPMCHLFPTPCSGGVLTVPAGIRCQWVYLHHESQQIPQIRVYFF